MSLRDHVLHHYQRFLGMPTQTSEFETPDAGKILLAEFKDSPVAGAISIATAGLSETLAPPLGNELLFACYERDLSDSVRQLLVSIGNTLAEESRRTGARLRVGAVLGPRGPILPVTEMTTLGVFPPVFHDERLATIGLPDGEVTVCWLVPLHSSEADWLRIHGYSEFVKRLHVLDPDFLDLRRVAVDPASVRLTLWERFRLRFL